MKELWVVLRDGLLRMDAYAVVDILLLAFVIYQLWRMIEGTRGRQLTQGIVVLVVIYLASRPLPVLHRLLGTAMQPAVIALVILFQPELRSALEQIGRIRPVARQPGSRVLHTIFDALDHFSSNRIGVLIALEGITGLSDVAETGTPLDAQVSVELLSCIFFPNNALHDGGVILRDDRIVAAACYFPPSGNPDAPRTLGMRHRAALGLAEQTDAVVLVVSEETGAISLAAGGQLHRNLKLTELRDRLGKLYAPSSPFSLARFRRRDT